MGLRSSKQLQTPHCHDCVITGADGIGLHTFMRKFQGLNSTDHLRMEGMGLYSPGTCLINGQEVSFTINMWKNIHQYKGDFQDYMDNLGIPFTRIFLFAYSITDQHSFEEMKKMYQYVYKQRQTVLVLDNAESNLHHDYQCLIVGFKCDLNSRRVVAKTDAETWSAGECVPYIEISTTSGQNLPALFHRISLLSRTV